MTEQMIASDGVQICTEAFGEPSDPAVLLIMGRMASMLWWPAEFCERLASGGRFVLRYDHRDTGRSATYEPGKTPYTSNDLVADAVAVLDGYRIDRAHLVGLSMGGVIAQLAALEHPSRVASITAISTTKAGPGDRSLPEPDAGYMQHALAFEDLDWSDTEALADLIVEDARQLAGSRHAFDEASTRDLVRSDLERARDPQSLSNHAMIGGAEHRQESLGEIDVPFLVIHGTADPLFPHAHGVALAEAVNEATLVTIEGGGHEIHNGDWDQILDAILEHTARVV